MRPDTDNTVDEKGSYSVTTSVLVTLRFDDVRESELRDLGSQNVLSSLEFELDASGLGQSDAWTMLWPVRIAAVRRGDRLGSTVALTDGRCPACA